MIRDSAINTFTPAIRAFTNRTNVSIDVNTEIFPKEATSMHPEAKS